MLQTALFSYSSNFITPIDAVDQLTVRCSSPFLTWNVCSKMVYMILPMPKDGSITLGTTSSTVGDKYRQHRLHTTID